MTTKTDAPKRHHWRRSRLTCTVASPILAHASRSAGARCVLGLLIGRKAGLLMTGGKRVAQRKI